MATPSSSPPPAWGTSGGDNARRGCFAGAVQLDPKPARELPAQGAVQASVVFDAQDRAFVADLAGHLQAFAADGQLLWRTRLAGGISATPVVDPEGTWLYAATHAGWVYRLECSSGQPDWRQAIPTKSDPRVLSDLLYLPRQQAVVLSSWGGRYHALQATSGKSQSSWDAGIAPSAAAAADPEENIYCLRAVREEGVQLLRVPRGGQETVLHRFTRAAQAASRLVVAAAPVFHAERSVLYFVANGRREGTLHAWSRERESLLWSRSFAHCLQATPTLPADGSLVLADLAGVVHVLAPDGSPRFRYVSGADYLLAGGVSDGQGTVYFGDPAGVVHRLRPDGTGQPVFEAPRSLQARPSFDRRGNLYIPSTGHQVYVFHNRAPA